MSKPIVRVVLSLVIALLLVAGVYTSVLGAKSEQAAAGVTHGLSRNRPSIDGANSAQQAPPDAFKQGDEGGCEHEAMTDPYD